MSNHSKLPPSTKGLLTVFEKANASVIGTALAPVSAVDSSPKISTFNNGGSSIEGTSNITSIPESDEDISDFSYNDSEEMEDDSRNSSVDDKNGMCKYNGEIEI